ncbi:helix-turn-helix domain-containing protein [Burkholderia sp. Ac-20392]|nr:helix-turn-helix domain-containing protein [Burkholderia sp. Ac-20392]
MAATERITMAMRELDRFKVIQDVADGKLKPWRAAERLELTTRQVRRLVARLREHGPAGLVSGHRAKPGNRRLDPGAADRALSIIRDRYADFGPTLACEKLWECHGIRLAKETVRRLMTDAGLWVPRRQRPPKVSKIFAQISLRLPLSVLKELKDRTGKRSITPHDLRHTCAVMRLHQLLEQGDAMDEALQKLRTFFGWSKTSSMPSRYGWSGWDRCVMLDIRAWR